MVRNFFRFAVLVILCDNFGFFRVVIAVLHSQGLEREPDCILSEDASEDYYMVREFIFTFLEIAETDFRTMNDEEKTSMCKITKENLNELIKKGKADWATCLTGDSAYFGDFVGDIFQNFLDFFCEKGSDHIEGYFTDEAKQCRAEIKKPLFDSCLVPLLSKDQRGIDYDLSLKSVFVPGKRHELCRKLNIIGPCAAVVVEFHCHNLTDYQQLSAKLFAQTVTPCQESTAAKVVGITLLLICVVIAGVVKFCPVRRWYADCKHRSASKCLPNTVI